MTETPPQQDTRPGPTGFDRDALRDLDRLRRSTTDRKIAGVAGGLGRHLNIDPTILRVLFVVLVFFGGAGLLLYGAAWLLVPEDGSDEAAIHTSPSTRTTALIVAGVVGVLLVLGDSWGGFGFPWPLAIVALVVVLVLVNKDRPKASGGTPPAVPTPADSTASGIGWPQADPTTYTSYASPTATTAHGWVGDTTTERAAEEDAPGQVPPAPPYGPGSWAPAPPAYQPQPRPSKKERGPRLFGFTLAFVAVALGALGLYDALGGSVVDSAYPALALTVVGAMLVWGAYAGRPGGLIFLGIVASLALATSSAADEYGWDQRTDRVERPQSAAALPSDYRMTVGRMVVDLTQIDDLAALDGRNLDIQAAFGEIRVIVPDGVDVDVDSSISLGGEIDVDGVQRDGNSPQLREQIDGGDPVPDMTIDIELAAGRIDVQQEAAA